ncbi:IS110 family transposase [Streptomyces bobili]|uniref:IS110 family transposase n=1 Tax=Streptomyces bobili TaxID=67280 RepID=UPI0037F1CE0C
MIDIDETGVFLGLDVGKSNHHGHEVTPAGKKVFDKTLPNGEPQLRAVFDKPKAKVRHHPGSRGPARLDGALPLAIVRDSGRKVAYLPRLATRQITDRTAAVLLTTGRRW